MLVYEYKLRTTKYHENSINEAIRTAQFIRFWMDSKKEDKVNYAAFCRELTKWRNGIDFPFTAKLNTHAGQASCERAWSSIQRFYDNCKKKVSGKKGFPKFKKNSRSVEYKTSGWKLSDDRKSITFTDRFNIGRIRLKGSRDIHFVDKKDIKRVRIVKRADGYYCQFCIKVERLEDCTPTNNLIGLDVGLESFYTDSDGNKVANPRFLRKAEKKLKKLQRRVSKKKKGSNKRKKAINRLGRQHLKVSRQRKDFVVKTARAVCTSNDVIVIKKLNVAGLVKNKRLAKSISDASWSLFKQWLEYFSNIFKRELIQVNPAYTSQDCSVCGKRVKKSLSTRTHVCSCGARLCRDENAAINILRKGTVGHTETSLLDSETLLERITAGTSRKLVSV